MTSGGVTAFHFATALLPGGWADNVWMRASNGLIQSIASDVPAHADDERFAIALPGLSNLHSHAFQRGMAGLAETRGGQDDSFWTWRETMYRFVDRLTPESLQAIGALAYIEMLETGFTRVGEFHYLHHDRDGEVFADPAEMSSAIIAAANDSGIGLTHLPVFYAHAGFGGTPPGQGQRRFVHDLDGFVVLLDRLRPMLAALPDGVLGVAPHSLRAVTLEELSQLVPLTDGPIHIHIAEQIKEVQDCLASRGARPVQWLLANAGVDARWCLVHSTHMNDAETRALAATGAVSGLCPITEANLGDGLFPASDFLAAGGLYGVGSDSNVMIDATEELRLLEYGQRLATRSRNVMAPAGGSTGAALYNAAMAGGARALRGSAMLKVGAPADFVTLNAEHPALVERRRDALLDGLIFAGGRQAIDTVWRRGRKVVEQGRHIDREWIASRYLQTMRNILA